MSTASQSEASARYKRGKEYYDAKEYDKAISEFRAAHDLSPRNALLFSIARSYHLAGNKREATKWYSSYLAVEPNGDLSDEAREYLAALKAEVQIEIDKEAARISAEDARRRASVDVHLQQANAYLAAANFAAAANSHMAAFELDGDSEHVFMAAEVSNADGKNPDTALSLFRRYIEVTPSGPHANTVRLRIDALTKQIEDARHTTRTTNPVVDTTVPKPPSVTVLDLASVAMTAAIRGDCKVARVFAVRVRQHDAEYYNEVVLPGLKDCPEVPESPPPPPRKRFGVGAGFSLGFFNTSSYLENGREVSSNKGGSAASVDGFVDIAVARNRVRLGLRVKQVEANYRGDKCNAAMLCPTKLSGVFIGPMVSVEYALVRRTARDVHILTGAGLGFPLGRPVTNLDQSTTDLKSYIQAQIETGLGFRFGRITVGVIGNLMVTELVNGLDTGFSRSLSLSIGVASLR